MEDSKKKVSDVGFLIRFSAFIVDTFIISALFGITANLVYPSATTSEAFLLYLLYSFFSTAIFSTTVGKYLFNMRVVTDRNSKIGWKRAFLREIVGKIISSIPFSLGYVWALFDKKKQAWHDKIAGSFVVYTHPLNIVHIILAYGIVIFLILTFLSQTIAFLNEL